MKEQTKTLKPCPFCGGKAKIRYEAQHVGYADDFEAYSVFCRNPACIGNSMLTLYQTQSEAIDAWNTRANARLIAAAPEMYKLLKILSDVDKPVDEDRFDDLLLAVDESRKLIARIDGEEAGA